MPHRIVTLAATVGCLAFTSTAAAQSPVQEPGVPAPPVVTAPAKDPNAVGQGVKVNTPPGRRVFGPRISRSLRTARAFWEARPHGCTTVTVIDADLLDEFGGTTVPGVPCSMWIGSGFFAGHTADDRVAACDEIVHQYGFLIGARRSAHPRSIMHPGSTAEVWGCDHAFLPHPPRDVVWATR